MKISCENEFCVYQKQGSCILKNLQLDIQGNCLDCIYINIEEDVLIALKEKVLNDLENRFNN
ncbi:MAG: hypothetical protein E7551_04620 [Ruminococcaceae bacterium]|nr:hypothetical protein [Oscillospiraceae bacterium]